MPHSILTITPTGVGTIDRLRNEALADNGGLVRLSLHTLAMFAFEPDKKQWLTPEVDQCLRKHERTTVILQDLVSTCVNPTLLDELVDWVRDYSIEHCDEDLTFIWIIETNVPPATVAAAYQTIAPLLHD